MKLFGSRPAQWTTGNITDWLANPAWAEFVERVQAELATAETDVEKPDPFQHGEAVGRRRAFKLVLSLPGMLRSEAGGQGPVKRLQ